MNPNLKAESIQVKDLAGAVDRAVKVAADKHKVQFEPGFTFNPSLINGRILRVAVNDFNQIQAVANEITAQVQAAHGAVGTAARQLTPTVLWQRGHILVGFVAQPPALFNVE